jgi:hypothetical protein
MEVYAAYLAYTDHEIGRVIQAIDDMGKLDNTLIIYISGDNGSSAEGTPNGTPNEMTTFNGIDVPVAEQMKYLDAWGSDQTYPHMAVGWTWAMDTPSSGPSKLLRILVAPARAWPSPGRTGSRMPAASVTSSTTSLTLSRRFLKPPALMHRSR